jgi:hypothetical protein
VLLYATGASLVVDTFISIDSQDSRTLTVVASSALLAKQ